MQSLLAGRVQGGVFIQRRQVHRHDLACVPRRRRLFQRLLFHGKFLWFTDNHVDLAGEIDDPADRRCAWMPEAQWKTAVSGMMAVDSVPDFIVFSGDFVHFPARNSSDLTKDVILETILSLTTTMQSSFPGIKLFPCLGNHDYSPSNNWPSQLEHSRWLYDQLAVAWSPWLPSK